MNITRVITAMILVLAATVAAAQSRELEERAGVRAQAKDAYLVGDFRGLEHQHATYADFLRQRTSSGAFKMTLFLDGIAEARRSFTEARLLQDIERTRVWAKEHNTAPLAHVLHAGALQAYGGYFRGDGFANTVPPQAWKVYEEYVRKGGAYLLENEGVASKSTTWHMWALITARAAGWPRDVVQRIFEAGVAQSPADFTLYRHAMEYFLPKWHGDAQAVDGFIRNAITRAPSEYGMELYARLYSGAGELHFGRRLYSDTLVDWKQMKEGLELWYRRFPTAWNKNIFAYHACIAADKPAAKRLLDEIGGDAEWQVWQPGAKATWETCVRWAAEPEAEPTAPPKPASEQGQRAGRAESRPAA